MMQNMLKSLISLSFISGAFLYLCPEGSTRRIVKILTTAILTAAILSPLCKIDYDLLALEQARMAGAEAEITHRAGQVQDSLKKQLLQENCENYIKNRGLELGLEIKNAAVELSRNENSQWLPASASIEAFGAKAEAEKLRRILSTELGIPEERQIWHVHEE